MGVIPNPKMAFIFPISCILALIFPILIKYFPKCVGKGSFPKSQIKSLLIKDRKHIEQNFGILRFLVNFNCDYGNIQNYYVAECTKRMTSNHGYSV